MGAGNDLIRDKIAVVSEIDASMVGSPADKIRFISKMNLTAWDALCAASGVKFSNALKEVVVSVLRARVGN